MTSRIGQPDTPADVELRGYLDNDPPRNFVMVAGAGSGKTTSLVKALAHLAQTRKKILRHRGQQIACITYTEVAVKEIWGDVGNDSLFHVSTIHSFLWAVVRSFQQDLREWVGRKINTKIAEAQAKLDSSRTRENTRLKAQQNIQRYRRDLEMLNSVSRFTYGTGSDYARGVLGHADILSLVPELIQEKPLLRNLIASRFPIVFVDESQDTVPSFVEALKRIAETVGARFCLGFFGDPMQKIYATGVGPIELVEGWVSIRKPENFRCARNVLGVINAIRAEDDGLEQQRGRMIQAGAEMVPVQGTARLILLPADERRSELMSQVRHWLAQENEDPRWQRDVQDSGLRILVIVHRMVATRLGFPNLYAALHDQAPDSLSGGLEDGTTWVFRPFLTYLLPLVAAINGNRSFDVMTLLRLNCPLMSRQGNRQDMGELMRRLRQATTSLAAMLRPGTNTRIKDVLGFAVEQELVTLDSRFDSYQVTDAETAIDEGDPESSHVRDYLECNVAEILRYQEYIEDLSPFATQQGVKGAEFDRVIVVVDDEEGSAQTHFSYGKYFGTIALSEKDNENISEGRDSAVSRTRRLFYVCCSRALQDLAVVVFSPDMAALREQAVQRGLFADDAIYEEADIQV